MTVTLAQQSAGGCSGDWRHQMDGASHITTGQSSCDPTQINMYNNINFVS